MSLTIVGLGVVGTSLGLALKAASPQMRVIGHDPDARLVARAKRLGAIDKSHWNLISACEKSDLIVLDLPLDSIENTLMALQHELPQGPVIIDTCTLKRPIMEWAKRILPETVQFVGGHVVLRRASLGVMEPSAELLKDTVFYLVAPEATTSQALDVASNLAATVGARPHYIDAVEHDGLVAAACQLPLLGALATVNTVRESAGWRDRARLVGENLSAIGSVMVNMPAAPADALLANANNLLPWLDAYLLELTTLRRLISEGDHSDLDALLTQAQEMCLEWPPQEEAPSSQAAKREREDTWRSLFLGGLGRRRRR